MKTFSLKLKVTALLTTFFFTATSIPARAAAVDPGLPVITTRFDVPEKLSLPAGLGSLQAYSHSTKTDRMVIYIQDAHSVIDAQDNIQNLISYFQQKFSIRLIAVEGVKDNLDPVILKTFPDMFVKKKVLSDYLAKGELSGPEMSAIFNEQPSVYFGIEEWGKFSDNYNAFLLANEEQEKIFSKLDARTAQLDTQRAAVFTPELNTFHEKNAAFRDEKLDLFNFLKYLATLDKDGTRITPARFPHLQPVFKAASTEESMKDVNIEMMIKKMAEGLSKKIEGKLTQQESKEFNEKYQTFVTGQIDAGSFLKYLTETGKKMGMSPKLTPQMREILGQTETLSMIKGTRLFEELEILLAEFENELAISPEQKEIVKQYHSIRLMRELAKLEWTRDQLAEYQKNAAANLALLGEEEQSIYPALDFYRLAMERDRIFMEKIEKRMDDENAQAVIVLTGGFHARGFEDEMKAKGYSYAVIMPGMNSLAGHENYSPVMRGDVSYKRFLKTTLYDAFVKDSTLKMAKELSEPDFRKNIKAWRDGIIKELSKQGRIAEAGDYTKYVDQLFSYYAGRHGMNGKFKSREEVLGAVDQEVERLNKETIGGMWENFQRKSAQFIEGFKALAGDGKLNAGQIRELYTSVASGQPSAVPTQRVIAKTGATVNDFKVRRTARALNPRDFAADAASVVNEVFNAAAGSVRGDVVNQIANQLRPQVADITNALDRNTAALGPEANRFGAVQQAAGAATAELTQFAQARNPGATQAEVQAGIALATGNPGAAGIARSESRSTSSADLSKTLAPGALATQGDVSVFVSGLQTVLDTLNKTVTSELLGEDTPAANKVLQQRNENIYNSLLDFVELFAEGVPKLDSLSAEQREALSPANLAKINIQLIELRFPAQDAFQMGRMIDRLAVTLAKISKTPLPAAKGAASAAAAASPSDLVKANKDFLAILKGLAAVVRDVQAPAGYASQDVNQARNKVRDFLNGIIKGYGADRTQAARLESEPDAFSLEAIFQSGNLAAQQELEKLSLVLGALNSLEKVAPNTTRPADVAALLKPLIKQLEAFSANYRTVKAAAQAAAKTAADKAKAGDTPPDYKTTPADKAADENPFSLDLDLDSTEAGLGAPKGKAKSDSDPGLTFVNPPSTGDPVLDAINFIIAENAGDIDPVGSLLGAGDVEAKNTQLREIRDLYNAIRALDNKYAPKFRLEVGGALLSLADYLLAVKGDIRKLRGMKMSLKEVLESKQEQKRKADAEKAEKARKKKEADRKAKQDAFDAAQARRDREVRNSEELDTQLYALSTRGETYAYNLITAALAHPKIGPKLRRALYQKFGENPTQNRLSNYKFLQKVLEKIPTSVLTNPSGSVKVPTPTAEPTSFEQQDDGTYDASPMPKSDRPKGQLYGPIDANVDTEGLSENQNSDASRYEPKRTGRYFPRRRLDLEQFFEMGDTAKRDTAIEKAVRKLALRINAEGIGVSMASVRADVEAVAALLAQQYQDILLDHQNLYRRYGMLNPENVMILQTVNEALLNRVRFAAEALRHLLDKAETLTIGRVEGSDLRTRLSALIVQSKVQLVPIINNKKVASRDAKVENEYEYDQREFGPIWGRELASAGSAYLPGKSEEAREKQLYAVTLGQLRELNKNFRMNIPFVFSVTALLLNAVWVVFSIGVAVKTMAAAVIVLPLISFVAVAVLSVVLMLLWFSLQEDSKGTDYRFRDWFWSKITGGRAISPIARQTTLDNIDELKGPAQADLQDLAKGEVDQKAVGRVVIREVLRFMNGFNQTAMNASKIMMGTGFLLIFPMLLVMLAKIPLLFAVSSVLVVSLLTIGFAIAAIQTYGTGLRFTEFLNYSLLGTLSNRLIDSVVGLDTTSKKASVIADVDENLQGIRVLILDGKPFYPARLANGLTDPESVRDILRESTAKKLSIVYLTELGQRSYARSETRVTGDTKAALHETDPDSVLYGETPASRRDDTRRLPAGGGNPVLRAISNLLLADVKEGSPLARELLVLQFKYSGRLGSDGDFTLPLKRSAGTPGAGQRVKLEDYLREVVTSGASEAEKIKKIRSIVNLLDRKRAELEKEDTLRAYLKGRVADPKAVAAKLMKEPAVAALSVSVLKVGSSTVDLALEKYLPVAPPAPDKRPADVKEVPGMVYNAAELKGITGVGFSELHAEDTEYEAALFPPKAQIKVTPGSTGLADKKIETAVRRLVTKTIKAATNARAKANQVYEQKLKEKKPGDPEPEKPAQDGVYRAVLEEAINLQIELQAQYRAILGDIRDIYAEYDPANEDYDIDSARIGLSLALAEAKRLRFAAEALRYHLEKLVAVYGGGIRPGDVFIRHADVLKKLKQLTSDSTYLFLMAATNLSVANKAYVVENRNTIDRNEFGEDFVFGESAASVERRLVRLGQKFRAPGRDPLDGEAAVARDKKVARAILREAKKFVNVQGGDIKGVVFLQWMSLVSFGITALLTVLTALAGAAAPLTLIIGAVVSVTLLALALLSFRFAIGNFSFYRDWANFAFNGHIRQSLIDKILMAPADIAPKKIASYKSESNLAILAKTFVVIVDGQAIYPARGDNGLADPKDVQEIASKARGASVRLLILSDEAAAEYDASYARSESRIATGMDYINGVLNQWELSRAARVPGGGIIRGNLTRLVAAAYTALEALDEPITNDMLRALINNPSSWDGSIARRAILEAVAGVPGIPRNSANPREVALEILNARAWEGRPAIPADYNPFVFTVGSGATAARTTIAPARFAETVTGYDPNARNANPAGVLNALQTLEGAKNSPQIGELAGRLEALRAGFMTKQRELIAGAPNADFKVYLGIRGEDYLMDSTGNEPAIGRELAVRLIEAGLVVARVQQYGDDVELVPAQDVDAEDIRKYPALARSESRTDDPNDRTQMLRTIPSEFLTASLAVTDAEQQLRSYAAQRQFGSIPDAEFLNLASSLYSAIAALEGLRGGQIDVESALARARRALDTLIVSQANGLITNGNFITLSDMQLRTITEYLLYQLFTAESQRAVGQPASDRANVLSTAFNGVFRGVTSLGNENRDLVLLQRNMVAVIYNYVTNVAFEPRAAGQVQGARLVRNNLGGYAPAVAAGVLNQIATLGWSLADGLGENDDVRRMIARGSLYAQLIVDRYPQAARSEIRLTDEKIDELAAKLFELTKGGLKDAPDDFKGTRVDINLDVFSKLRPGVAATVGDLKIGTRMESFLRVALTTYIPNSGVNGDNLSMEDLRKIAAALLAKRREARGETQPQAKPAVEKGISPRPSWMDQEETAVPARTTAGPAATAKPATTAAQPAATTAAPKIAEYKDSPKLAARAAQKKAAYAAARAKLVEGVSKTAGQNAVTAEQKVSEAEKVLRDLLDGRTVTIRSLQEEQPTTFKFNPETGQLQAFVNGEASALAYSIFTVVGLNEAGKPEYIFSPADDLLRLIVFGEVKSAADEKSAVTTTAVPGLAEYKDSPKLAARAAQKKGAYTASRKKLVDDVSKTAGQNAVTAEQKVSEAEKILRDLLDGRTVTIRSLQEEQPTTFKFNSETGRLEAYVNGVVSELSYAVFSVVGLNEAGQPEYLFAPDSDLLRLIVFGEVKAARSEVRNAPRVDDARYLFNKARAAVYAQGGDYTSAGAIFRPGDYGRKYSRSNPRERTEINNLETVIESFNTLRSIIKGSFSGNMTGDPAAIRGVQSGASSVILNIVADILDPNVVMTIEDRLERANAAYDFAAEILFADNRETDGLKAIRTDRTGDRAPLVSLARQLLIQSKSALEQIEALRPGTLAKEGNNQVDRIPKYLAKIDAVYGGDSRPALNVAADTFKRAVTIVSEDAARRTAATETVAKIEAAFSAADLSTNREKQLDLADELYTLATSLVTLDGTRDAKGLKPIANVDIEVMNASRDLLRKAVALYEALATVVPAGFFGQNNLRQPSLDYLEKINAMPQYRSEIRTAPAAAEEDQAAQTQTARSETRLLTAAQVEAVNALAPVETIVAQVEQQLAGNADVAGLTTILNSVSVERRDTVVAGAFTAIRSGVSNYLSKVEGDGVNIAVAILSPEFEAQVATLVSQASEQVFAEGAARASFSANLKEKFSTDLKRFVINSVILGFELQQAQAAQSIQFDGQLGTEFAALTNEQIEAAYKAIYAAANGKIDGISLPASFFAPSTPDAKDSYVFDAAFTNNRDFVKTLLEGENGVAVAYEVGTEGEKQTRAFAKELSGLMRSMFATLATRSGQPADTSRLSKFAFSPETLKVLVGTRMAVKDAGSKGETVVQTQEAFVGVVGDDRFLPLMRKFLASNLVKQLPEAKVQGGTYLILDEKHFSMFLELIQKVTTEARAQAKAAQSA